MTADPYAGPAGRALRMAEARKEEAEALTRLLESCPWWRFKAKRRIRELRAGCIEAAIGWVRESARLDGDLEASS